MRRLGVLVPAAIGLGLVAEWTKFGWRDPGRWIPDLLVGWTFVACGLIARSARPEARRSALLLGGGGIAWFVPNLAGAGSGLLARVLASCLFLHRGPVLHLVIAYPEGRTTSWVARGVIAASYAISVIYPVWSDQGAAIVLALAFVAFVALRYERSVGRERRARLPAVWAAVALSALLAGEAVVRLSVRGATADDALLWVYEATLCAIAIGLTIGLVTAPWERVAVADLVVELGEARSRTLRDELARALGDPGLVVGYRLPGSDRFVDADGREVELPDGRSERSMTMVERDGRPVAVLVHDPTVLGEPALVDAVSAAAKLAALNARLNADIRARQAEVRASRQRILESGDRERERLERRLHDGAQWRLDALARTLRDARASVRAGPTVEQIAHAESQLMTTQNELRRLARGLHPHELTERGLAGALASLADNATIPVELSVPDGWMPPNVEACVYFVCSEALANVAKYASASVVRISVRRDRGEIAVTVEDDGVGGADPEAGSGLRGLTDRVHALGGTFRVESRVGAGTRLSARIPIDGARS